MKSGKNNQIRIGAGQWRSRVIRFPTVTGLRPTSDRVREIIFNWLGQSLHGRICLDAFAGSGALGFEAASRGAELVVMCESNPLAVTSLYANAQRLNATQCNIIAQDVLVWINKNTIAFDVVFCDPPFNAGLHTPFLESITTHLSPGALIYVEMGEPLDLVPMIAIRYDVVKSSRAGAVYFGLLRHKTTG
ncbi:MAG: 16S rRNA (guanine(966)-N(2))-methyltransferase RsmD [Pseudomonadota bacterium]